ncbi:MAG: hypothetical protein JWP49_147 [Phenylobacterium sp.]|nr:hypothetical protein [Phenylobacterium sp.]
MRKSLILTALAMAPAVAFAQAAPTPPPVKPPAKPAKPAAGHTVGEVVVTGQGGAALTTSIDRRSYSVTADLQAQTGSIGDALRNVPSVEVDVQGNVSLRGDPNVTILIDGKPAGQFQGDNKAQALQSLPANQIERVEVITNPSAEFRADGTGGIINLISKTAHGAGPTGSLKVATGSAGRTVVSATGGYNSNKLSVAGDLNLRWDSQKNISTEDRQRLNPATGGFDLIRQDQSFHSTLNPNSARLAVDYDLDAHTRLSGELRGNYVDFTVGGPSLFTQTSSAGGLTSAFQRDLDLHQERSNGAASATLKRKFAEPGHEFTLNLTYDATEDERVRAGHTASFTPILPASFDRQQLDYDFRRTDLKGDYVRPLGPGSTLKAGFELQVDDNAFGNQGFRGASRSALAPDATLSNQFLFKQSLWQGYATYERPFGDVTVLAGLRAEDVRIDLNQLTQRQADRNDYTKLYPSLHLAWKLDDRQQLTASYSHRVQRPDPLQFNSFRLLLDPLNFRAGNAHLKPSETHSYEAGYEYRASPTIYLAILYYRENFNGFADVLRDLGDGVFLSTTENVSKSRAAGVELVASGRLAKGLTYNLSSNLYWNEISPQPLGAPETRSAFGASGRGAVSWQATPDDLVQLNLFLAGTRLNPQGEFGPFGAVNLGYRRKLTDKVAFLLTVNDLLHTVKFRQVIDTPLLKSRQRTEVDSRQVQVGVIWTFGGGRARDPGFDFGGAGAGGGAGPP